MIQRHTFTRIATARPHDKSRVRVDPGCTQGNPSCLDLLGKMLVYDPNARITAAEVQPTLARQHQAVALTLTWQWSPASGTGVHWCSMD